MKQQTKLKRKFKGDQISVHKQQIMEARRTSTKHTRTWFKKCFIKVSTLEVTSLCQLKTTRLLMLKKKKSILTASNKIQSVVASGKRQGRERLELNAKPKNLKDAHLHQSWLPRSVDQQHPLSLKLTQYKSSQATTGTKDTLMTFKIESQTGSLKIRNATKRKRR